MKRLSFLAISACLLSLAIAQTSNDEKAAKRAEKLKRQQQLESCIVLINSANFHQ